MTKIESVHSIEVKDTDFYGKEADMNATRTIGMLALLMAMTACAPVAYGPQTTTRVRYETHPGYHNRHYGQGTSLAAYEPIQVTLHVDRRVSHFDDAPTGLVIRNGERIRIPARNRQGRSIILYAHYLNGDLHFDSSRRCRAIHGASRYRYDKSWRHGAKYSHVNLGRDFDTRGITLEVRRLDTSHKTQRKNRYYGNPESRYERIEKSDSRPHANRAERIRHSREHRPRKHDVRHVVHEKPSKQVDRPRERDSKEKSARRHSKRDNNKKTVREKVIRNNQNQGKDVRHNTDKDKDEAPVTDMIHQRRAAQKAKDREDESGHDEHNVEKEDKERTSFTERLGFHQKLRKQMSREE